MPVPSTEDTLRRALIVAQLLGNVEKELEEERSETPTEKAKIWRLLQQAAEVEVRLPPAMKLAASSGALGYHHTPAEIRATENQWAVDGIKYQARVKVPVTAAQAMMHEEVMTWLRFVKDPHQRGNRKLLWALAGGIKPQQAADMKLHAARTANGINGAKNRALKDIEERLTTILKG